MSATLEWFNTGLGTKTGTTAATLFADLVTLAGTVSANSDFLWEVKGSNTGSTPYYVSFGRKDGSPGRIAVLMWTSGPAGNNSAILDTTPTNNQLYVAYFPNGTGTTLANLAASSGAITGDDTNCVKVSCTGSLSQVYTTSLQAFYFESQEGIAFGFGNPAAATTFMCAAGELLVDGSDTAYGATIGYVNSLANFGSPSSSPLAWTTTANLAGSSSIGSVRTNYGSANRVYYHAFLPAGPWANAAVSSTDVLSNTATQDYYFAPVPLMGMTKGEGTVLKLRQIAWGSGTVGAFTVLNTTGPEVNARQFCHTTTGGNGYPWFLDDKI